MFDSVTFEPARLVLQQGVLEGEVKPGDLEGLKDLLASSDQGALAYHVDAGTSFRGNPLLRIQIHGWLSLACQRCLEGYRHDLVVNDELELVKSEADLPDLETEESGKDAIVDPGHMDLAELLQEEILLALPLAPLHPEGQCGAIPKPRDSAEHPFAALARLKSGDAS
jgi:uncharacterized protein